MSVPRLFVSEANGAFVVSQSRVKLHGVMNLAHAARRLALLSGFAPPARVRYVRRRPEATPLYELVRDNLETLYGAIDDGALQVRIGKHARKELEGYLQCGVLGRGFARMRCGDCNESRVVAFSCKGRGFCP